MLKEDRVCPYCGTVNKSLFLDETGGWMECIGCGKKSKGFLPVKTAEFPVHLLEPVRKQNCALQRIYSAG